MKTFSTLFLSTFGIAAVAASASTAHRRLQNFPPANAQGQFRPGPMGPAGGVQGQLGVPMQGTNLDQFPVNPQMPGAQNFQNGGMGAVPNMGVANTQIGAGEADVTATGSAAGANADPAAPSDAAAATAPGAATDLAPGQPTIMVILPDSIATHSGWASYSGDVGETTSAPATQKPAEPEKPAETSAATATVLAPALLTMVAACGALDI